MLYIYIWYFVNFVVWQLSLWWKSPSFVVDVYLLASHLVLVALFAQYFLLLSWTMPHVFMALCSLQIYTNLNDNLCNTSLSTFCNCKFRVLINVKTWICKQYIQNECPFTLLSRFYLSSMINRDTSAQES